MFQKYIIIIEDDPDTAEMIEIVVRSGGYDCEHFSNLQSMAKMRRTPDSILLDYRIPGILVDRGFIGKLRGLYGSKIFLISGIDNLREKSFELNADGYLLKPFEPDRLLEMIQ